MLGLVSSFLPSFYELTLLSGISKESSDGVMSCSIVGLNFWSGNSTGSQEAVLQKMSHKKNRLLVISEPAIQIVSTAREKPEILSLASELCLTTYFRITFDQCQK